jgi:hypothetical protein
LPELWRLKPLTDTFTDKVVAVLKAWKVHVVDQEDRRVFIEEGFTFEKEHASDTIQALHDQTRGVRGTDQELPDCAFEATATIIVKLLSMEGEELFPFAGATKHEPEWCVSVLIWLLITIYCDMKDAPNGYFMALLGGPKVPKPFHERRGGRRMVVSNAHVYEEELKKLSTKQRKA